MDVGSSAKSPAGRIEAVNWLSSVLKMQISSSFPLFAYNNLFRPIGVCVLNFQAWGAKMACMNKLLFLLPAVGLFMFSCASLQFVQKESDVLKLAGLVDEGNSRTLTAVSVTPFLFDGEIIMLPGDVAALWNNIAAAGLSMGNPAVIQIDDVDEETARIFGNTMEIEAFFRKYLPETARAARLSADSGNYVFLLNGKEQGYPKIHGLKVY